MKTGDPAWDAFNALPIIEGPWTEERTLARERAEDEIARGEYIRHDDVVKRLRDALPPVAPPPLPEMYEELMACGCWPLSISREQAEEYWTRRRAEVAAR